MTRVGLARVDLVGSGASASLTRLLAWVNSPDSTLFSYVSPPNFLFRSGVSLFMGMVHK